MSFNTSATTGKCLLIAVLSVAAVAASAFSRRVYANADATTELAKMFEQDQDDRTALEANPQPDQWAKISTHDKEHRDRVLELMHQDKFKSGDDYYYAAMIMQHGSDPKDFMLAHILAMAAAQRGSNPAVWLSAASLDRLMQSTGQPQVFGTQYFSKANEHYTMREPIEPHLITDSVRKAFNVPTLMESTERLKELNSQKKID